MKTKYALKNLLHALTLLLAANVVFILSGCAALLNEKTKTEFYPEYYAARHLNKDDITKLRDFRTSLDEKIAVPASLILGIHYLKHGDRKYGKTLIDSNYLSSALDDEMKLFGKLWKIESLLLENKKSEAEEIAGSIKNYDKNAVYYRTLKLYCGNEGRSLIGDEDPYKCVEEKLNPSLKENNSAYTAKVQEGGTNNMTYEEYLSSIGADKSIKSETDKELNEKSDIYIVGGDVVSEMAQGMIYAISKLKSNFAIEAREYSDNVNAKGIIINIKKEEIITDGKRLFIGEDWSEIIKNAAKAEQNRSIKNIIICAHDSKMKYAEEMEKQYNKNEYRIKILTFNNKNFINQLKNVLGNMKGSVLIAGIGAEDEIMEFITVAKYLQTNRFQRIMVIMNSFTGKSIKSKHAPYFKGAFLFTPIMLVNNENYKNADAGYETFFGRGMNYQNIIGYDSIVYLTTLFDKSAEGKYISGIKRTDEAKAFRPHQLYRINKELEIKNISSKEEGDSEE